MIGVAVGALAAAAASLVTVSKVAESYHQSAREMTTSAFQKMTGKVDSARQLIDNGINRGVGEALAST